MGYSPLMRRSVEWIGRAVFVLVAGFTLIRLIETIRDVVLGVDSTGPISRVDSMDGAESVEGGPGLDPTSGGTAFDPTDWMVREEPRDRVAVLAPGEPALPWMVGEG